MCVAIAHTEDSHTNTGIRGATEIKGITFRDLRDSVNRAVLLASSEISPSGLYEEAALIW